MRTAPLIEDPFYSLFQGYFISLLSWEQMDDFWEVVRNRAPAGWYVYAIGEAPPAKPSTAAQVETFVSEINTLLRREHQEDYCGIVYTDSQTKPTLIKIYDPNNLGVQCGYSDNPPLPGWVMSLIPPSPLENRDLRPEGRKRWWSKLWG